jgi:hypothetical protein
MMHFDKHESDVDQVAVTPGPSSLTGVVVPDAPVAPPVDESTDHLVLSPASLYRRESGRLMEAFPGPASGPAPGLHLWARDDTHWDFHFRSTAFPLFWLAGRLTDTQLLGITSSSSSSSSTSVFHAYGRLSPQQTSERLVMTVHRTRIHFAPEASGASSSRRPWATLAFGREAWVEMELVARQRLAQQERDMVDMSPAQRAFYSAEPLCLRRYC